VVAPSDACTVIVGLRITRGMDMSLCLCVCVFYVRYYCPVFYKNVGKPIPKLRKLEEVWDRFVVYAPLMKIQLQLRLG